MAFLDEQGLQRLADKINVRSSKTLPNNAPDGTIIIDPDEDTEIFNVDDINIDVDSALSLTSTNPVQNKVVTKELERIPCKLTIKCAAFDGEILTQENASTVFYDILDGAKYESHGYYPLTSYPTVKMVYKNYTYRLMLIPNDNDTKLGCYYDPIVKGVNLDNPDTLIYPNYSIQEKVFTVIQDTEITIVFQKKREPITLTINLKDKNGNFVSDDVIVTDSFDNTTTTVGTYGKTPGQFTIQVTKGYEYTITPSLKGFNSKENNSPADPNKTTITQTSTEDTIIDIVYNKTYPNDYETDWASFHAQIAANPGTEVLPIGTELITIYEDTTNNKTVVLKWNIVNWRYGEKEDGSQVWGCDLFQKGPIPDNIYVYDSGAKIWGKSEIRNTLSGLSKQYQNNDFKNNLQAVKVTTSIIHEGPAEYSYDRMWIPSATELYINTTERENSYHFTTISEGNDNEAYWKNIIGIQNKIVIGSSDYQKYLKWEYDENNKYMDKCWLRSTSYFEQQISGEMKPDGSIQDDIIRYDVNGQFAIYWSGDLTYDSQEESNAIRPMCFFA